MTTRLIGLSKERPILDHHPKAQSEMRRFSWNAVLFIWNAVLFIWKALHFSWKALRFSYEKHLKSLKTADSTQISHLDLVFHRVQREGHLWKAPLFMWKAPLFERPLARNCNPMFTNLLTLLFSRLAISLFGKLFQIHALLCFYAVYTNKRNTSICQQSL